MLGLISFRSHVGAGKTKSTWLSAKIDDIIGSFTFFLQHASILSSKLGCVYFKVLIKNFTTSYSWLLWGFTVFRTKLLKIVNSVAAI